VLGWQLSRQKESTLGQCFYRKRNARVRQHS
jgi:hypothetical protein